MSSPQTFLTPIGGNPAVPGVGGIRPSGKSNRGPRAELVLVSQDGEYGRVEEWQSELGKLGS